MSHTPSLGMPAHPTTAPPPTNPTGAPPPTNPMGAPPPPRPPLVPARAGGPRALGVVLGAAVLAAVVGPVAGPSLGLAILLALPPVGVLLTTQRRTGAVTAVLTVAAWAPLLVVLRADLGVAAVVALAAPGLTAVAATTVRGGDPLSLGGRAVLRRIGLATGHAVLGPTFVARATNRLLAQRRQATAATRGILQGALVAAPLVAVMAALLASGDAVFAEVVRLPTVEGLAGHLFIGVAVGWLVAGALRAAATPAGHDPSAPRRRMDAAQAMGLLVPVCGLFVLFVAVQVVAAAGGADHVLEAAGLTRAEYAREGFFQLLAVAALTLTVLVAIRVWVRTDHLGRIPAPVRHVAVLAAALVVVIVAVAVIRLDLYVDAFGLTRLRLWSTVASVWIGGCFAAVVVRLLGWRPGHSWLLPATVAWGLVLLVGLGLAGPDHLIATRNLALAAHGRPFDVGYALSLSDDAVPALAEGWAGLPPAQAEWLRAGLCDRPPADASLWGLNVAARRADLALTHLGCPGR